MEWNNLLNHLTHVVHVIITFCRDDMILAKNTLPVERL